MYAMVCLTMKLNPGQHMAIVSSLLFYHLDKMREEEWGIFNKNNG
jgi:hypothetical protein